MSRPGTGNYCHQPSRLSTTPRWQLDLIVLRTGQLAAGSPLCTLTPAHPLLKYIVNNRLLPILLRVFYSVAVSHFERIRRVRPARRCRRPLRRNHWRRTPATKAIAIEFVVPSVHLRPLDSDVSGCFAAVATIFCARRHCLLLCCKYYPFACAKFIDVHS